MRSRVFWWKASFELFAVVCGECNRQSTAATRDCCNQQSERFEIGGIDDDRKHCMSIGKVFTESVCKLEKAQEKSSFIQVGIVQEAHEALEASVKRLLLERIGAG